LALTAPSGRGEKVALNKDKKLRGFASQKVSQNYLPKSKSKSKTKTKNKLQKK
jgi:hypothetical protein